MLLCLSVFSNAAGVTEYGGSKTVVMKVESIIYICNKGTFLLEQLVLRNVRQMCL